LGDRGVGDVDSTPLVLYLFVEELGHKIAVVGMTLHLAALIHRVSRIAIMYYLESIKSILSALGKEWKIILFLLIVNSSESKLSSSVFLSE
jgi:hypothetical protein